MRRTYSAERYIALAERLRAAVPDLALGTDIIVGFPGETEEDFAETLAVVEEVRYDSAFTFIYSPRAGTEAAAMPDQVAEDAKHDRLERLVEVVQRIAAEQNAARIGRVEEVLVEGPSRTDPALAARPHTAQHNVNFAGSAAPGDIVPVDDRRGHVDHPARRPAGRSRRLTRRRLTRVTHPCAVRTRVDAGEEERWPPGARG